MREITKKVQEMYMQYPFPARNYQNFQLSELVAQIVELGLLKVGAHSKILDVGCGTGHSLINCAQAFPQVGFLGFDISTKSVEMARENAIRQGIGNIEWRVADILDMDLAEKFDAIVCIGVLHHLADMQRGMQKLADHLVDGGIIILWLYGKYGRFRINLNQQLLRLLFSNVESREKKVELAKKALSTFPQKYLECFLAVPYSDNEDFGKNLEFVLADDTWLVDQFLHENELTLTMNDILRLTHASQLQLRHWFGQPSDVAAYTDSAEIIELFQQLPADDQLRCIDLLVKPADYLVVVGK